MKLNKKAELFQPIRDIWDNLNYKDISTYEELNLLLNENKIITKFNSKIDNGLFHSITNFDNMNICLCFGLDKNQSYDYYLQNLKILKLNYLHLVLFQQTLYFIYNLMVESLFLLLKSFLLKCYDLMALRTL